MGLFDNIFLDKDTPTTVLNQTTSIESDLSIPPAFPKEESKSQVQMDNPTVAFDSSKRIEGGEKKGNPPLTNSPDVTFDIGGDLNFGGSENNNSTLEVSQSTPLAKSNDSNNAAIDGSSLIIHVDTENTIQGQEVQQTIDNSSIALVQSSTAVGGMMIIDESSGSNSAIQNTQEPTSLIISESTSNQHTEVSSSDNSAGQEGEKISITKKTSENIETTSNEESHGGMDALFGFSVEENTDHQPASRLEKDVSAQGETQENITIMDISHNEDSLEHVLIESPKSNGGSLDRHNGNKDRQDDKVETMLQDFIEQLNDHKVHMIELDELSELKLRDIQYRQEALESEYREKLNVLNIEKKEILEQKQEKQEKANKLERIIAALEAQCDV